VLNYVRDVLKKEGPLTPAYLRKHVPTDMVRCMPPCGPAAPIYHPITVPRVGPAAKRSAQFLACPPPLSAALSSRHARHR
jgi:hypothetical protein